MLLDSSARRFEVVMAEVKTTSSPTYGVEYIDKIVERETPVVLLGKIADSINNIVVPPPLDNTRRVVGEMNIHNDDTVTHHFTLLIHDIVAAVSSTVLYVALTTNQTLHYNLYSGWQIL